MKILKIFGLVAGIHVFALILIFANPGCSSTSKPTPVPTDTVARPDSSAMVSVPMTPTPSASDYSSNSPLSSAAIAFNPDAPATAGGGSSSGGVRFNPIRPNTREAAAVVTQKVTDVTPATTYTVKSGDTLWELGKRFKLPYAEIATANNLKAGAALHAGQKLIIPSKAGATATGAPATATVPTPAAKSETRSTTAVPSGGMKYTVKPGESLSAIARNLGVKQADIVMANNITDPAKIQAGTELVIPGWQAAAGNGKAATKSGEPARSTPAAANPLLPGGANPMTPAPASNDVPVIKVEENPLSPTPKGN